MHFEDGNDHTSYEYDMINIMLTMPMIDHSSYEYDEHYVNNVNDHSSDGGNEKNFPLPPDWAAPRQSLPPSPSFQVDDNYIIMLVMEILIIVTIIMTWQSLPPSLPFQIDGLI